jgi:2,3-bisphosphoglycerate-dependent phosphoglycerate mutase
MHMKPALFVIVMFLLLILPGIVTAQKTKASAKKPTVVYIVRHAEKVITDPNDRDPALTEEGLARADELKKRLQGEPVAALYSTAYKRTRQTMEPLAKEKGLAVEEYDVKDPQQLVKQVLANNKGQTVVVAGHSNTLLELIEAFGTQRPINTIEEDEYYYLFRLEIASGKKPVVQKMEYGKTSRTGTK